MAGKMSSSNSKKERFIKMINILLPEEERQELIDWTEMFWPSEEKRKEPEEEDDVVNFLNRAGLFDQARKLKNKNLIKKYKKMQNESAESDPEIF